MPRAKKPPKPKGAYATTVRYCDNRKRVERTIIYGVTEEGERIPTGFYYMLGSDGSHNVKRKITRAELFSTSYECLAFCIQRMRDLGVVRKRYIIDKAAEARAAGTGRIIEVRSAAAREIRNIQHDEMLKLTTTYVTLIAAGLGEPIMQFHPNFEKTSGMFRVIENFSDDMKAIIADLKGIAELDADAADERVVALVLRALDESGVVAAIQDSQRKQRRHADMVRRPNEDKVLGRDRGGVKIRSAAEMPASMAEDDNPGDEIE